MKKKIYVADDDPAILEICKIILEDAGYEVETSTDGRSIEYRNSNLPVLIFLDVMMSGTNGNEICRTIKNREDTKNLPVVLISANSNLKEIGTSCGADAVLTKPFDIDKLVTLADKYTANVESAADHSFKV